MTRRAFPDRPDAGAERVVVGPLHVDHAGEVLTVQRAAYVTEAQRYDAPHIPPLLETLDELRAELSAPSVIGLGAWLGSRLVGAVRGRLDGTSMEVSRFVVVPDQQGRGVGRALLEAVHAAAPDSVHTCWLITGERSEDNVRLYRAAGYEVTGSIVDVAGIGLVRMERRH